MSPTIGAGLLIFVRFWAMRKIRAHDLTEGFIGLIYHQIASNPLSGDCVGR